MCLNTAISLGHIQILEWAKANNFLINSSSLYDSAIKNLDYHMITWLMTNNITKSNNSYITFNALKLNNIEMLTFLYDNGFRLSYDIFLYATIHNNFDMIQWALDRNMEKIAFSLKYCSLEMLEYLLTNA